jgi:DnaJ-class molecular chaperone|tara:strand:+ start:187 stop:408 length:222 start_codon:yes stop_codon:yes gene_type:complete
MAKTELKKNRTHVAICNTCNGNGYITVINDLNIKQVHQCWDCNSEGEYYVYEPEMVSSSNDDNNSGTDDITMH